MLHCKPCPDLVELLALLTASADDQQRNLATAGNVVACRPLLEETLRQAGTLGRGTML